MAGVCARDGSRPLFALVVLVLLHTPCAVREQTDLDILETGLGSGLGQLPGGIGVELNKIPGLGGKSKKSLVEAIEFAIAKQGKGSFTNKCRVMANWFRMVSDETGIADAVDAMRAVQKELTVQSCPDLDALLAGSLLQTSGAVRHTDSDSDSGLGKLPGSIGVELNKVPGLGGKSKKSLVEAIEFAIAKQGKGSFTNKCRVMANWFRMVSDETSIADVVDAMRAVQKELTVQSCPDLDALLAGSLLQTSGAVREQTDSDSDSGLGKLPGSIGVELNKVPGLGGKSKKSLVEAIEFAIAKQGKGSFTNKCRVMANWFRMVSDETGIDDVVDAMRAVQKELTVQSCPDLDALLAGSLLQTSGAVREQTDSDSDSGLGKLPGSIGVELNKVPGLGGKSKKSLVKAIEFAIAKQGKGSFTNKCRVMANWFRMVSDETGTADVADAMKAVQGALVVQSCPDLDTLLEGA
ncbi:unnamed protein product [Prorocentrum cordatum]|uniref:Helix-hairpin-helix DNA-binding motif class 1 domain-containing protein n=1 Tax=Prorocentrum cordatum TaxID=2364126 RepID=A0ABN9X5R5_9DINO|nr:unnamed protein product [Polarella glacialis]